MKSRKPPQAAPGAGISRRELLFAAAAGSLGVGSVYSSAAAAAGSTEEAIDLTHTYPFYGHAEQAGIRTPPQRYVFYMTFDLTSSRRTDLQVLLARWSGAIAQLMNGQPIGQVEPVRPGSVGCDTGRRWTWAPHP